MQISQQSILRRKRILQSINTKQIFKSKQENCPLQIILSIKCQYSYLFYDQTNTIIYSIHIDLVSKNQIAFVSLIYQQIIIFNIQQMAQLLKTVLTFILFILILTSRLARPKKAADLHKTVVESNHFFSEIEKKANYNVDGVEINKPLILILKKKSNEIPSILKNTLTITLVSGKDSNKCQFFKYEDLCVLQNISDPKLNMIIQCNSTPCEVSWIIYQPPVKDLQQNQKAQDLFSLQKSSNHMMAQISCNDAAVKTLDQDITVYAESHYERSYSNNIVYLLFNNEEKGYMYVDIKEGSKNCAILKIINVPSKITFSQNTIGDFTLQGSPSVFQLEKTTSSNFRIDVFMHKVDKTKQVPSVIVKLTGQNDKKRQTIASQTIKAIARKQLIDFSYVFMKVDPKYSNLKLSFQNQKPEMVIINFMLVESESFQEVELGETSYFDLKKSQSLIYRLLPQQDAEDNQKLFILSHYNKQIKISDSSCGAKLGCDITIEALEDTNNFIYISSESAEQSKIKIEGKEEMDEDQIQFFTIKKNIKRKIREGDFLYFKKQVKKDKAFQVTVNTPNVLIRAASKQKCKIPKQTCFERTGNYHHPFVYDPQKDGQFLFSVEGLDNSLFSMTIIDEDDEFIKLEDNIAFSYTMDDRESKVAFKFKLNKKETVSFNLIGPLNALNLMVNNGKQMPSGDFDQISPDGYLSYTADQIKGLDFVIVVEKLENIKDLTTHFTIIASSSATNLRLQPSTAHYDTLEPSSSKRYAFEFNPKQDYILTSYTHNIKADSQINIRLQVSNNDKWDNTKQDTKSFIIDSESDSLNLKDVSKELCEQQKQSTCQIFIKLTNQMTVQIDLVLTLIIRNAVIELKDGIWQNYPQNQITSSAHFYYYPKNQNKNVVVLYDSLNPNMRMSYKLFKTDIRTLNPQEWPFLPAQSNQQKQYLNYKPNTNINIYQSELKQKCWPSCVVLITFYEDKTGNTLNANNGGSFKLMASNNQIEIPYKTRVNLMLNKNEVKELLIDLKYILDQELMTVYVTNSLNYCGIQANVYSQKNPRCPIGTDANPDFYFYQAQNQITVDEINKKLESNSMEKDNNRYLCLTVTSNQFCKCSVEYTTDKDPIKNIHLDSFEEISLIKDVVKLYKIDGNYEFSAKILRNSGFPFIAIKKCQKNDDLNDCLSKFKQDPDKGKQLVTKTQTFTEYTCEQCVYFFKLSSIQPASLIIHLQSNYAQTELQEKKIVLDFINQNQVNKYWLHGVEGEDLIANIHVQEGQIEANLVDFAKVNMTKQAKRGEIMHFVAVSQPTDHQKQVAKIQKITRQPKTYHLLVKSKLNNTAASYSITYSSGKRETELQDGLILDYTLDPKKVSTFYYVNQISSDHIYFTVSMDDSTALNNLKIKAFYMNSDQNDANRTEFAIEKPPMRKKTPNPTLLIAFPKQNFFAIELSNPKATKQQKVSLGINHQQVILLPFNHEYPFTLHQQEQISMLVDVNIPGFLKIIVRKCDKSDPSFSYTFDYSEFVKGVFMYSTTLNNDPVFQYHVKAQRIGTFYMNFKSEEDESSLLSVKIEYSNQNIKKEQLKAGNKGLIQYQILQAKKAQISLKPVICPSKKCSGIKYYTMSAKTQQDLYSQLVCPSSYFSIAQATSITPISLTKINFKEGEQTITFSYDLIEHISYLGVKAIDEKGQQIYYRPIEINTIWGQLSKVKSSHKIAIGVIATTLICVLLICVRKAARKGYRPIEDIQ